MGLMVTVVMSILVGAGSAVASQASASAEARPGAGHAGDPTPSWPRELGSVEEAEWRALGRLMRLSPDQLVAWERLRVELHESFLAAEADSLVAAQQALDRSMAGGEDIEFLYTPDEYGTYRRQVEAVFEAQLAHFERGLLAFAESLDETQEPAFGRVAALVERRLTLLWCRFMMTQRAAAVDLEWDACMAWFGRDPPKVMGRRFLDAHFTGYGEHMTPLVRRMARLVAHGSRVSSVAIGRAFEARHGDRGDGGPSTREILEGSRAAALGAGAAEAQVSRANVAWLRNLPRQVRLPGADGPWWDAFADHVLSFAAEGPAPSLGPLRGLVADLRGRPGILAEAIADLETHVEATAAEVDALTHRMILRHVAHQSETGSLDYEGQEEHTLRMRHEADMLSMSARRLALVHDLVESVLESSWIDVASSEAREALEEGRGVLEAHLRRIREKLDPHREAGRVR